MKSIAVVRRGPSPREVLARLAGTAALAFAACEAQPHDHHPPTEPEDSAGLTSSTSPDPTTTCATPATWHEDEDGDGFGSDESTVVSCSPPPGYLPDGGDCDDLDATIAPGAEEVLLDGIDQNCNGSFDDSGCAIGAAIEVTCDAATVVFGADGIAFGPACQQVQITDLCLDAAFETSATTDVSSFVLPPLLLLSVPAGSQGALAVICDGCQPPQGDTNTEGTLTLTPVDPAFPPLEIPLVGYVNGPNDA